LIERTKALTRSVQMTAELVNVDNFARAESNRMFSAVLTDTGGVNRWAHNRVPTPLDHQPVIRQNRDTLYSAAIVDISAGATLTIPESGDRYISLMPVNQDHYVNTVFHEPGEHHLTQEEFETPFVCIAARILVDPADPDDVAAVNALQDELRVRAGSERPFVLPDYDQASFDLTRQALLELATGIAGFDRAFGRRDAVDPVRHLIGTAAGWGGLPEQEATYVNVNPGLPVGRYQLTVRDVPVDAFWSISLYNAAGYFVPNERNANSVNSITAVANDDGSVTVSFGEYDDGRPNCLPIMDGWNYLVRLYQPRPDVLDGSWVFPAVEPV
jgi:hypothetical protein